MRAMRTGMITLCAALSATAAAQPADPGWPRVLVRQDAQLVLYQPQVDEWKDFRSLQWRSAFQLTPATGAKPIVGAGGLHADTLVDHDNHVVLLANIKLTHTHFPGLDAASADQAARQLAAFVPSTASIALHRIVASTPKPDTAPAVPVRNDPPRIFVSTAPAVPLFVDGKPVRAPISGTQLEFVVNTQVPVIFDVAGNAFYLLAGERWLKAAALSGPWSTTRRLPNEFDKLKQDPQWAELARSIPPASVRSAEPRVLYSEAPSELIVFAGRPDFKRITGTSLLYAANTESPVFLHEPSGQLYYLTAGRWFRAPGLDGPWAFATHELPADFARIPPTSPAGRVRASVPGTEEAKDAVLLAQIPTTLTVSPQAAAQVRVAYQGDPKFEPIAGTTLFYAVNTAEKVLRVGDVYYLCLQGVWFFSTTPAGPWQVAPSVPQVIYTIPPSSPVYNVTYVTQVTTSSGAVQSSYTSGYMGVFVVGVAAGYTVAYGSGFYYPPYVYYPPVGYPIYRPYPMPYGVPVYNTATGAYGWGAAAYGPYGSAAAATTYNPSTGTYARGATASSPYGSRSVAQAYNPYTGTYAASAQGSSPTAQWGSTVVSQGGQTAYAQHTTTAAGTVGSVQTSSGGQMAGVSQAGGSSATVGRTASGDYYATKDGSVYRNSGSGWEHYDNGSWNTVQQPQAQTGAPATTPASAQQSAQQRAQGAAAGQTPTPPTSQATASQATLQSAQQSAQQRTPSTASGQATAAQASGQQRTAGASSNFGQGGGGSFEGIQREAQNRERGSFQSQQFERSRSFGGGTGRRR